MRRIPLIEKSYQQSLETKNSEEINSALEVAAVNFQDYQGQLLGVVITHWFMGLLLLPVEIEGWRNHQTGDSHKEMFPAGEFEFTHGWDPLFGAYGSCPLFSPMDEFADQRTALMMAERAMSRLFIESQPVTAALAANARAAADNTAVDNTVGDAGRAAGNKTAGNETAAAKETVDVRRRGLLTGSLFRRK